MEPLPSFRTPRDGLAALTERIRAASVSRPAKSLRYVDNYASLKITAANYKAELKEKLRKKYARPSR
jgi:hypothetical protein